jgi:glycopeptide antibiotics resistance protein
MYAIILAILVPLGLGSRYYFHQGLFHIYGGDVLYATFFYFCFRFLKPELSFKYAAVFSLLFCYGIEISQFYQAPWITEIRHTFLGGLILGFGFLWSDIICYTLGVLLGFVIDVWLYKSIESQELSTISRSK